MRVNASLTIATFGRVHGVGRRELAAPHHRHPHRRKKPAPTLLKAADVLVSGPASKPSTATLLFQLSPASSGIIENTALDTPGSAASFSSSCSNSARERAGVVAVQRRRQRERDQVVGLQAELDAADVEQALREEPGRDEQRHRHRDLHRGERGAEPLGRLGARRLTGLVLERGRQVGIGAVQRREQPEQHAGDASPAGAANPSIAGIEREGHERQRPPAAGSSAISVERPLGDEHADRGAQHGEQHRLGEQLPHQLPAAGADRQPHRHLGGTAGAADQQQVGDVRAGDQQHRAGDREQDQQRRAGLAVHVALTARARLHRHGFRRNRAMVCSLIPCCSGASTSLTMAR